MIASQAVDRRGMRAERDEIVAGSISVWKCGVSLIEEKIRLFGPRSIRACFKLRENSLKKMIVFYIFRYAVVDRCG